jgi:arylsulfatase
MHAIKMTVILAAGLVATVVLLGPHTGAQEVLPRPEPPFEGHIGRTTKESTKDFPQAVQAPKGPPNILLILTDDVGFGTPSTFGGPIQTPTMDRLANNGMRHNQFHTTALCQPTRAALLTGRNHHSTATGSSWKAGPGSRVITV